MKWLLEIARCPVITDYLNGQPVGACEKIIAWQEGEDRQSRQVPEPWSGRLVTAKLLFLSSNPSISHDELYPTAEWPDERIVHFFESRFDGGEGGWTKGGTRFLQKDGSYSRGARFWSEVRRRAEELYGCTVRPGYDYALSEVVHCKSKKEFGVREALPECTGRYLKPVLQLSGARVIAVLGAPAAQAVRASLDTLAPGDEEPHKVCIENGRDFLFLRHPNFHGKRRVAAQISPELLGQIRRRLQG